MKSPALLLNTSSFERNEAVEAAGKERMSGTIPPNGYKIIDIAAPAKIAREQEVKTAARGIENEFIKAHFDESGRLKSLVEKKSGRNIIPKGYYGNEFQIFEDYPNTYDAWDIDIHFEEKKEVLSEKAEWLKTSSSPLRGQLKFRKRFGKSEIIQTVELRSGSPRLDFITEIEWRERHKLLKVAFPTDIRADKATFDIQFGNVERNAHDNTSWDLAMFEVPAHKWADISETDFGFALLNDCKYGYDCKHGVLRLSVLRAPTAPDLFADQGNNSFIYSAMPHSGDFRNAGVVKEAHFLNMPLIVRQLKTGQKGQMPPELSFVRSNSENIIIDTAKLAEDGSGDMIIRACEYFKKSGEAVISFAYPIESALETDMLERRIGVAKFAGKCLKTAFKPFEIKTFRVRIHETARKNRKKHSGAFISG